MRPVRRHLVLLALLALATTTCRDAPSSTTATARVAEGEVVQRIAAPARIAPADRRTVSTTIGGTVTAVFVQDGAHVEAGAPVLALASDQVDVAIAQAAAASDAAAALAGLRATTDLSPIVALLRGQLDATVPALLDVLEAQAEQIENPERRRETLASIAQARAAYADSRAQLVAAEEAAAADARSSEAAQAQAAAAQQRQAQVALDAARAQLDGLTLAAPIAGTVEFGATGDDPAGALGALGAGGFGGVLGAAPTTTAGPIAAGSELGPAQTVFTVYDVTAFHLEAEVDEVDVALLATGQPALVLVDAFPDVTFDGYVDHIAVAPRRGETGGVAFPVRVALRGLPPGVSLRVGLTSSVEIEVRRVTAPLTVPSSALLRRGGAEVVLVDRDGVAEAVPVRVVAIGEETAAVEPVTEGDLSAGARVVVRGTEDLDDGDRIP